MSKQRILSIEYIRGVAMLGVVGIHTGSYMLENPHANIHLFALFEIASRFSVPIFFFVSAFGLFWSQNLQTPFHYKDYIRRRFRTVLLPYVTWSVLYLIHASLVSHDISLWHPLIFLKYLFFGLASYQLYFLVILLWFYLLMPLWRTMLRLILAHPLPALTTLFIFQIAFDYYSSYFIITDTPHSFWDLCVEYRLNYWVLHYLFIFLFGGYCAQNFTAFKDWVAHHKAGITTLFIVSFCSMLVWYYYLLNQAHYTPEAAANLDHQLSPPGILYTLAASLFLFMWFQDYSLPAPVMRLLKTLSDHSYLVYLVHPFFMYFFVHLMHSFNVLFTFVHTSIFYCLVVAFSILFGKLINQLRPRYPYLGLFLTGNQTK